MSVDPLTSKYASLSPFHYSANNPIRYVDTDGEDFGDFLAGLAGAIADNSVGTNYIQTNINYASNQTHFAIGNFVGNAISVVQGVVEIATGATLVAAGGTGEAASVTLTATGVGAPVGVPGVVASTAVIGTGVAAVGHGSAVLNNVFSKSQRNVTRVFKSRKAAKDARPKPKPAKKGQKGVTRQTRNKKGEGNKMKTDHGTQTEHFHDRNHNDKSKPNVHYRTTKKVKPEGQP